MVGKKLCQISKKCTLRCLNPKYQTYQIQQALGDDSPNHFWLHTVFCNVSGFVQCTMSRVTIIFAMFLVILRVMAIYQPKTVIN